MRTTPTSISFAFLRSNLLDGVVRASQEELNQRAQATAEARTKWLKTQATDQQLRDAVNQQLVISRQQAQQAQADRELASAQARFEARGGIDTSGSGHGYPPLPEDIDAAAIKAMGGQEFRQLIKRYGDHQINVRLRKTV
jgi:hypothetical protein